MEMSVHVCGVSFGGGGNILALDGGEGWATLWTSSKLMDYIL